MNILVTGAAGALGRNLVENLKAIRDGKNRTRPNLHIEEIYEYDINNAAEDLDRFCSDCDFIVHAAGVNRPKNTSEFMEGNFGFTSTLLDKLKEKGYSSTRLRKEKLLGESYMSQLRRGDMVSWAALDTICTILECQVGDLIQHERDPRVDKTTEVPEDL